MKFGMFGLIKENKDKVKDKLDFKDLKGIVKDPVKYKNEAGPSVAEDVTKEEFIKRYKNVKKVSFIYLIFLSFAFYLTVNMAIKGFVPLLSGAALFFFLIAFIKNGFTAWKAQYIFENWHLRLNNNQFYGKIYIKEIIKNPLKIWPKKLEEKNDKKNK